MNNKFYQLYVFLGSILGLILIMFLSCNNPPPIEITFAAGPDNSQAMQFLIDKFNYENKGEIKVNWQHTSSVTNENFEELQKDFKANTPKIDVFASDVIWTGILSAQESVEDVTKQFYNEYNPRDFVQAAMNSTIYNFSVYGVPWFTDASLLYYRKDLLEKHGFIHPPKTWDELKNIATVIMEKEQIPYGYVFQGDKYEGGVTNACEFIWNAGGQVMIDNLTLGSNFVDGLEQSIITVDSKPSEDGWRVARELIEDGISPEKVSEFRELETTNAFLSGETIFMRGWPGVYGAFLKTEALLAENQVGISPIPVIESSHPSSSCLGGWNLMIAKHTSDAKKEAAWAFIKYLTAAPQQKSRALRSGALPSLKSLYEDKELIAEVPVLNLVRDQIQNAKRRPISVHYMEYSTEIATLFNQTLKGEILPEYAIFSLQEYLENIQLSRTVAEH